MSYLLIKIIKIYQLTLSPEKGAFVKRRFVCRFQPTCSNYFIEALENYSLPKAIQLGLSRLLRCHPFGNHGYDPLPPTSLKHK